MTFDELARFGLTTRRILLFVALNTMVAVFEGVGIAMFLPILEFIESDGAKATRAAAEGVWVAIWWFMDALTLPVNLASLVGAALVLLMLRVVTTYLKNVYNLWVSQYMLHRARSLVFEAHLRADLSHSLGSASGDMVNLATFECSRLAAAFLQLFTVLSNAFVVLAYVAVLAWLSVSMTAFAVVFLALAMGVVMYLQRHTVRLSRESTVFNEAFSNYVVERLSAAKLIKLLAKVEPEARRGWKASESLRGNQFRVGRLGALADLVMEPVVVFSGVVILYVAVTGFGMSLAQVGLFMLILLRLMPLTKVILQSFQKFQASLGGVEAVRRGMRAAEAARERFGGDTPFERLKDAIVFNEVRFTYPGRTTPALDGVSFTLPAGRMTAVVGPSGSGKTTMVNLLPGLFLPQDGEIRYDGLPLADYEINSLRRGVAFVTQDSFVFNDTVRANITYAREDADDDEVWQALTMARSDGFVRELPQGLDTMLGERGARLSGGQLQRLSLARALVQKASILVLDEPTSALDSEVERDIQHMLDTLRREGDVTLLVIAHRLSTINKADKIVVMQEGRVVQEGSHADLMTSENWYRKVVGLQQIDA